VHRNEENVRGIKECFLLWLEEKGNDLLCRVLEDNGIDIQLCKGQGYENGSNMAGIYNAVQTKESTSNLLSL